MYWLPAQVPDRPTGKRWARRGRWRGVLALGILCLASDVVAAPYVAPPFEDTVVLTGLTAPTAIRFAPDGRVFVAEQSGLILVYERLDDPAPQIFADLTENVYARLGRGLLGLALHPEFGSHPFVYVLYTYDAPPGETAPVWNDVCPTPPGTDIDGCVVTGRLSRLTVEPGAFAATEEVLIEGNWCQQFRSHSLGSLAFGPDGALYASAGDGASFFDTDYGQLGGSLPGTPTPQNACGDPPLPAGGDLTPPDAEGGALRSQDLLTPLDPVTYNGAILRIDPETGEALPDNPLFGGGVGDDRIIAFGLRNPYRFTIHPQTGELWIADVGWRTWEEINRIIDPTDTVVENFGWPCFEGDDVQEDYAAVGLNLCTQLYETPGATTPPFYMYEHGMPPDPDRCGEGMSTSISGLAFYPEGDFPVAYDGALFFADIGRQCIWTLFQGPDGLPDPASVTTLVAEAAVSGGSRDRSGRRPLLRR